MATPVAAPAPAACLPAALLGAVIQTFVANGEGAVLCFAATDPDGGDAPPRCLALDKAGTITGEHPWSDIEHREPPEPPPRPFTLTTTAKQLSVCATGTARCSTIPKGYPKPEYHDEVAGAVSDDGARVFVLDIAPTETGIGEIWADTYEVATHKRLARIKLTTPPRNPDEEQALFTDTSLSHEVRFVGTKVVVGEWYAGPAGNAVLFDPISGARTYLHGYGGSARLADPKTLVVEDGKSVTFVDLASGKQVATFTAPSDPTDEEADVDPEATEAASVRLGDTLLFGYARPPGLAVIDLATHRAGAPRPLPICR